MSNIYKQGENRKQQMFFPPSIDEYVSEDNTVRAIEDYVELLDMVKLGFIKSALNSADGQPAYHPKLLLKIYIYGYLNKIRSSRKLELEIKRNIEMMWLCAGLTPSNKTISNFRKENAKPLKKVFREFVLLCKELELITGELVAVPEERHEHLGFDVPVRRVKWTDAVAYASWKSEREGKKYRLPTEAEWEYACRAGSEDKFCFGDDESLLGEYAWYADNAGKVTHDVGTKKPNAWGLYDMHGNVWEWCLDRYADDYSDTPIDGSAYGVPSEKGRVLRGGSYNADADKCSCTSRINLGSGGKNYFIGFRLVEVL